MKAVAILALIVLVGIIECARPAVPPHVKSRMDNKKKLVKQQQTAETSGMPAFAHHAKRIWNMRPWKKAPVKNTTEESAWGHKFAVGRHHNKTNKTNHTQHPHRHHNKTNHSSHHHHHHHHGHHHNHSNCSNKTNHSHHHHHHHGHHHNHSNCSNKTNHTWTRKFQRFVEESSFFNSLSSAFDGILGNNRSNKTNHTQHHNHTWNNQGYRFAEETTVNQTKPSFLNRIKKFGKKIWAKRPWKKAAAKNTTEESNWNSAGYHFNHQQWNHSATNKTNHTWNSQGYRFAEETNATKPSFLHRAKNFGKKIWAMRPWKKAAAKNTTEESAYTYTTYSAPNNTWNSAGTTYPVPNNTWNSAGYTYPQQNNTWNSQGYRFAEETAAKPSFIQRAKNFGKKLWAKRPWKKAAAKNTTEESAYTYTTYSAPNNTWNSAGTTYPAPNNTWNSAGYTYPQQNTTWNSQGYRFEESANQTLPTIFHKVHHHVKNLLNKRQWKRSD